MRKLLPILLSAAALYGCSKEKDNTDKYDPGLRVFATTARIAVITIDGDALQFQLVGDPDKLKTYNAALEVEKDGSVIRYPMTSRNQILTLTGLPRKAAYKTRLLLSSGAETQVADSITAITASYSIDYKKMYNAGTPTWTNFFNVKKMVGVADGTQVFYGEGFSNQTNTAVLIPPDDPSTPIYLKVTTVNDNELSVKFPANMFPNPPYVDFKNYYLKINNEILRSSDAIVNSTLDSVMMKVWNNDIILDSAVHRLAGSNNGCMYISLNGRFLNQNQGVSPRFIQGLQAIPSKTEVEIFQGTTFVTVVEITQGAHQGCNTGFAVNDNQLVSGSPGVESMLAYNEIHQIVAYAQIPAGTYNMNVKFTLDDGSIKRTNKMTCVVTAPK
ncbi:hypothetical protein [Chitinophaga arvensicola]|uniref:Uncharacterized protein n=1 Tax=Chitinophaga arvensicola TaxID=29529 RepID=A0A1I0SDL0_9BACT|nr:hypothetical protein [Chitinophaga arvensicola]SEW56356.1 hypothetical protein SAMN04488122_6638 [Chitinophaga arvensicola]